MFKKLSLLLVALCLAFSVIAQENGKATKAQKKADKKKEQAEKKAKKADKKAKEKHLKIQTKDVRKRMKKNKKRSAKNTYRRAELNPGINRSYFFQQTNFAGIAVTPSLYLSTLRGAGLGGGCSA